MRPPLTLGAAALALAAFAPLASAQTPATTPSTPTPAPSAAGAITDAELQNFAAAQAEIEPINRAPQTTDAQRQAAIQQMRDVLARHNLTGAEYNQIVNAVNADPALAQRLVSIQQAHSGG